MADTNRQECSFKEKCYRKNPHHFREFTHEHLGKLLSKFPQLDIPKSEPIKISLENLREQLVVYRDIERGFAGHLLTPSTAGSPKKSPKTTPEKNSPKTCDKNPGKRERSVSPGPVLGSTSPPGKKMAPAAAKGKSKIEAKLEAAAPFNFLLTKVKDNSSTHRDSYSVYMSDLLHPSLGEIKSSLQINFMVEYDWLMMNYEVTKNHKKPLVILYGQDNPELTDSSLPPNIRAVRIKPKYPYGTHHTKMMVFVYEDESVRVVIHTANLYSSDWENRTQGVWVSPRCPKLGPGTSAATAGESPTRFKASLLRYLRFYEVSALNQFVSAISACDMSSINVVFIASVPNSHRDSDMYLWGQKAVEKSLRASVPQEAAKWPVNIQCSSIGSLGQSPDVWLEHELGRCLSAVQGKHNASAKVELVYPSHNDVMASYDGPLGGGCLPYRCQTHTKQLWLQDHCNNWKAEASDRTRAMPHIKTYTRVNPNGKEMAYFILTSANLSKAAWGSTNKAGKSCMIMSYEAGVLFLPKYMTGEDFFEWTSFESREAGSKKFPVHYDIPTKKYGDKEKPWLYDFLLS